MCPPLPASAANDGTSAQAGAEEAAAPAVQGGGSCWGLTHAGAAHKHDGLAQLHHHVQEVAQGHGLAGGHKDLAAACSGGPVGEVGMQRALGRKSSSAEAVLKPEP